MAFPRRRRQLVKPRYKTRDEVVDILTETKAVLRKATQWLPPRDSPATQSTPVLQDLWREITHVAYSPTPGKGRAGTTN